MNQPTVFQKVSVAPAIAGVLGREVWMNVNITKPELDTTRAALQELRAASTLLQRAKAAPDGVVTAPGGAYVGLAQAKAEYRQSVNALCLYFSQNWTGSHGAACWKPGDIEGLFSLIGEVRALDLMNEALILAERHIAQQAQTI